ncbi:MAG: winged helix-turn-helix domain-containing protein [Rhodospirillaceae bacterium]|jgi:uncharacterized protein|nr:winged helix-turn-helix domain-containing protein [Rhodospirillaceae bacterium]MBT6137671.1 winged helix-turn-helix domain-containing protein [Rhodospirillaceae bacterium]
MVDRLNNREARRLFIARHGLAEPVGSGLRRRDLPTLIESLGFVQIDSIRTVERAHHHILFSRAGTYRPSWLAHHLERERSLFEHWTHDASIVPVEYYAYWKHRFAAARDRILSKSWWRERLGNDREAMLERVLARIEEEGPILARELNEDGEQRGGTWWGWRPSKSALEFLWHTGAISVTRREGFQKVYDLSHRVIPDTHFEAETGREDLIDWACRTALDRLGIATPGELAAFFDLISPGDAKTWVERTDTDAFRPITVELADGSDRDMLARPDLPEVLAETPDPPGRLRILSPFDPMLRDRKRAERLFGFDYRFEAFVPGPQRQYGYYVFPILEGDRLVGRIDMRADRDAGALTVRKVWPEPRLSLSKARSTRLDGELERWRRYLGFETVRS